MIQPKQVFLNQLNQCLGEYPKKDLILEDYACHIDELMAEIELEGLTGEKSMAVIINHLGSPEEIAESWKGELLITPSRTKWLFFLLNLFFFIGGSLLTLIYHLSNWYWAKLVWNTLISVPFLIMFIYTFFWGLLGYEIGKEFGHGGRVLLKKTFFIALIPNLTMMAITVLKLIPYEWFHPLLDASFIVICILATALLYPISWLGFLWGKKASI